MYYASVRQAREKQWAAMWAGVQVPLSYYEFQKWAIMSSRSDAQKALCVNLFIQNQHTLSNKVSF